MSAIRRLLQLDRLHILLSGVLVLALLVGAFFVWDDIHFIAVFLRPPPPEIRVVSIHEDPSGQFVAEVHELNRGAMSGLQYIVVVRDTVTGSSKQVADWTVNTARLRWLSAGVLEIAPAGAVLPESIQMESQASVPLDGGRKVTVVRMSKRD